MIDYNDQLGHVEVTVIRRKTINVAEAKARLSELVQRAAAGEEITIARNGEPQARLVALPPRQPRVPGSGSGKWNVADDFNAPLPPDLLAAFSDEQE
jgi:prevent-host-death family protein